MYFHEIDTIKNYYFKCAPTVVPNFKISTFSLIWPVQFKNQKKDWHIGEVYENSKHAKSFSLAMRSRKKIIHGARIEISTAIRNNHIFLCNTLQNLDFEDLLPHGKYLQIWKTRHVMKYFSAHFGIHGFAPIWYIF